MRKRSLLLVGGTGFIGGELLRALTDEDLQSALVLHASPLTTDTYKIPQARYERTDMREADSRRSIFVQDINRTIILTQPDEMVTNGILKMLDAAPSLRRILYVSSILIYPDNPAPQAEETIPDPCSLYERGKQREELLFGAYAARRNIPLCIARLSNVYGGPKSTGIISKIFHAVQRNTAVPLRGDGTQERDYIFVEDVAAAFASLLQQKQDQAQEIFNVCTGHGSSLNDIMLAVEAITNRKLLREQRAFVRDKQCVIGANEKLSAMLPSFHPISLHDGLRKVYARFHEMGTE